jgi:type VI secretion system secreted protein VgrG
MSDLITISSSALPASARVIGFRGVEAISRPYELEVFLVERLEPGDEPDLADAIGAKAALTLDRARPGETPFVLAGVIAAMEVVHAFEGQILLRATIGPRLAQLGLSRHSRIFTKMKVPDIITTVLAENGVTDVELRLGAYETEEHVCQYRESDLAFISRWMEREGIFYFFEHSEDGEKLVLCDRREYDDDALGLPVRYFPESGHDHSAGQAFRAFRCLHSTQPTRVRLKDYDYAKPQLNVAGQAEAASNGAGEVSIYGERFFTAAAGARLSKIRAEEILARQVVYRGQGTRMHLRSGATFELLEHPIAAFNARYLAVEARHSGNQATGLAHFRELTGIDHDQVYRVEVDAVSADLQFRAARLTPWPRVHGYENGTVDGPAESDYAQIDEQGRYNAKFRFDESKLKGGKATTFVRMAQPHGGDIEGFHFPLRKGTEVVFSFLDGDPDRPVISGVVPNALNPSPVTSGNHTRNVIQTGGRNRFEMEDKAGQERITISTPYANTYLRMGSPNDDHELILHTDQKTLLDAGLDYNVTVSNAGGGDWATWVVDGSATLSVPQGNYRIGTLGGIAANVVDGVTLHINKDHEVPASVCSPSLDIDVDTGGALLQAKKDIEFTSESADINLTAASGDVDLKADKDHKVAVGACTTEVKQDESYEIILGASFEHREADSWEVVIGNTYETKQAIEVSLTDGNSFEATFGNTTETTLGASAEIKIGNSDETIQGTTMELFVGEKLSIDVSASAEATLSALLEIAIAQSLVIEIGLALEMNFALNFELEPASVEIKPIEVKNKGADVKIMGSRMQAGAVALKTIAVALML